MLIRQNINGIDETHCGPFNITTRAQMVTFLWRCAGCQIVDFLMPFGDVEEGSYYEEAVRWGASVGYVKGISVQSLVQILMLLGARRLRFYGDTTGQ